MNNYKTITQCRSCYSTKLTQLFSIGEQYVSDFVEKDKIQSSNKVPITLVLCERCKLIQQLHTAPQDFLYTRHYWYRSGINESMRKSLENIVNSALQKVVLRSGDVVLDIGSNDGTLLRSYPYNLELIRVGVEPARNLYDEGKVGIDLLINDFWDQMSYIDHMTKAPFNTVTKMGSIKPKIITAIGMFYDLCVKPDTMILGEEYKPIEEYKIGDKVFNKNGELDIVVKTYRRKYTGNIIKIKPKYLESIEATNEHPILIVPAEQIRKPCGLLKRPINREYTRHWKKAEDVKKGDYVVVPFLKETDDSFIDEDTAWFFGIYVAEGYTSNDGTIGLCLHKKETHIVERIKKFLRKYNRNCWTTINNGEGIVVRMKWKKFAFTLNRLFNKGAKNKQHPIFGIYSQARQLPLHIMTAPRNIKIKFLSGLFEGDGYINKQQMTYRTASKTLAVQVQLLCASIGIMLGISKSKPRVSYTKTGHTINSGLSYALTSSKAWLTKLFSEQKTVCKEYKEWNNYIYKDDALLIPVSDVTQEHYEGDVCNIETLSNSYLVSNAVVHNCNPNKFIEDIAYVLHPDGLFIAQLMCAKQMYEKKDVGNLAHEHLEFYTLESLEYLLNKYGLVITDVEENSVNGGSYRLYIRHIGAKQSDSIKRFKEQEKELHSIETWDKFYKQIEYQANQINGLIFDLNTDGKSVWVLGASTKGNVLLQYWNLQVGMIRGASERSKEKVGKYTVGTGIPIYDENEARKCNPDYMLILPYTFSQEVIARERAAENKCKFIIPLPELRIVE